jgi:hypothetical protein
VRPIQLWTKALGLACVSALALASCSQDIKITATRYALIYGVRDYPGPFLDLSYTVNDANSMSSLLSSQGWTVRESTDSAATKAKIQADILALSTVSPDATILVYFSGHGTYIDPHTPDFPGYSGAYLVPYDAVDPTSQYLQPAFAQYLISQADLGGWISAAASKNVIVILDCCNSGGFVSPGSAIDSSPQDYSLMPAFSAFSTAMSNFGALLSSNAAASGNKAPIVLSAAGSLESSYDGTAAMAHGVFTYYFLESATKGDSDGDGFVTTTEAYAYTAAAITKNWSSNPAYTAFLPHLSGGVRDLVLFTR